MESCKLARSKVWRSVVQHGKGSATYFEIIAVAQVSLYKLICLSNITFDINTHYNRFKMFLLHSSFLLDYAKTFFHSCLGKGFRIKKVN